MKKEEIEVPEPEKIENTYFVGLLTPRDWESYTALLGAAISSFNNAEKLRIQT